MATITVPAETPRKQVVVGGTPQTSFTFDFVIYDVTTDIRLFNGATELTIGSDFTVSGTAGTDGGFDGGTVTMAGSFSSGLSNVTVTILSKIAIKRTSNLASTGPLDIDLLNKDLNRTVSMLQKFEERQDRMPALEEETSITLPIVFPSPSASKIISWNSGATGLEATLSTSDVTGAAASAAAAAASATAASTSQSASATSASAAAASATSAAASAAAAAVTVASQAEAETGTNNANLMTPLRTKQAVDSYGLLAANNLSDVTASTARTNLGLGDAATGTIGTDVLAPNGSGANLTALNASNLASGTVPTARLGSGTASATTFLAGDGAWKAAGGKVVGYQNTNVATRTSTTSTFPDDDTVPQSSEGAEYTTVAYTPTEGGNKIVIHIIAQAAVTGNEIDMALALFKNSDASAIRSCFFENGPGSNNGPHIMSMMVEDTAADTSEITYKLRFGMVGNTSGTAYLGSGHHSIERFGDSAGVQIHITEYDA